MGALGRISISLALSAWAAACGPLGADVDFASGPYEQSDAAPLAPPDPKTGGNEAPTPPDGEICDDGLDNNDNGLVDEGCPCVPGATQSCFLGPPSARGQGVCRDGTQKCMRLDLEFGQWGACEGSGGPSPEVCDALGLDEDCSGAGNEGCECTSGQAPVPCGPAVGECRSGAQECVDGHLGPCVGAVGPSPETCNGKDDDCDGETDENLVVGCGSTAGECTMGTSTCLAGVWGACEGAQGPRAERCNGKDDDCDGVVDNDADLPCGVGNVGECTFGFARCVDAVLQACDAVFPRPETCNGVDDDCNGIVDENLTRPCGTDVGACQSGTETCEEGAWVGCTAVRPALSEACDGVDNNCNGVVDEGCQCLNGATQPCGVSAAPPCQLGVSTCANGRWGSCAGNRDPAPAENCRTPVDDNCNGEINEGCVPPVATCPPDIMTQPLATVTLTGSGSDPDGGAVTYQWTVTTRPQGSSSNPSSPTSASTNFFVDLAGTYVLTFTVTDDDGYSTSCEVTITATPPPGIHVELVWDTGHGDVDLHVVQPDLDPLTNWFQTEEDCYYGNTNAAWPPSGNAGNATLDRDDTNGYGPENIRVTDTPQAGSYAVGVAYYCSHSLWAGPGETLDPGNGPTTATIKIYCDAILIDTFTGIDLERTGRFVDLARIHYTAPGCTMTWLNDRKFVTEIRTEHSSSGRSSYHCDLPCTSDADCGTGERCSTTGSGGTHYCEVL